MACNCKHVEEYLLHQCDQFKALKTSMERLSQLKENMIGIVDTAFPEDVDDMIAEIDSLPREPEREKLKGKCTILFSKAFEGTNLDNFREADIYLVEDSPDERNFIQPDDSWGPTADKRTFAVEVGKKFYGIIGKIDNYQCAAYVQYVLFIKLPDEHKQFTYRLYSLDHTADTYIKLDSNTGLISITDPNPRIISMDSRRLMLLRDDDALPNGVPDKITIDVMELVRQR